jgi:hypothetical protein
MTATTRHDAAATTLPARTGPRPTVTRTNPQTQLDQQPRIPLSPALIVHAAGLPGVRLGDSRRAPAGTTGFHLDEGRGPARAFMLDREFAHVHPGPDHSLHLTLPPEIRDAAIAAGWAKPHPMAGQPTVSADLVMVYAPRDADELAVAVELVSAAWRYAAAGAGG